MVGVSEPVQVEATDSVEILDGVVSVEQELSDQDEGVFRTYEESEERSRPPRGRGGHVSCRAG